MADNPSNSPMDGPKPPLPSSGMTGRIKSPTTQLPIKKGGAGKIVVMLSSVAKPAPAGTQRLPKMGITLRAPIKLATPEAIASASPAPTAATQPPPLPPQKVVPAKDPRELPESKMSATTFVKLPPKTSIPQLSTLSGMPIAAPTPVEKEKETPEAKSPAPLLPKKSGAQLIPPIKLNEPEAQPQSPGESIFATVDLAKVQGTAPAVVPTPKVEPTPPVIEAKETPAPAVAPPLLPPQRIVQTSTVPPALPPPLPLEKEPEIISSPTLHVAPPLVEKVPESISEKLPQPHLGTEARKAEPASPPPSSDLPGFHKVPALIQPDASTSGQTAPHAPPPKPASPPPSALVKAAKDLVGKTTAIVVSSTSKKAPPEIVEAKPALRPPALPKRALPNPDGDVVEPPKPATDLKPVIEPKPPKLPDAPKPIESVVVPTAAKIRPVDLPPDIVPALDLSAASPVDKVVTPVVEKKAEIKSVPLKEAVPPPVVPVVPKASDRPPLPQTRVARAAKRRRWETVVFYLLFAATLTALFFGGLHFGRDTRVEGQVIPPAGMLLNNEVWIVTDFSSLASGIADDLAKDRLPLMQESKERQEHVQRAQADIAARESRIRLIQDQINSAKSDIANTIKQSRAATQAVWDQDGGQIDDEYNSRLNQFGKAIADRAKSLNLKYEPDTTYKSPEVWANAYRLALYQVPAGVDSVKEHQWLGDQMKQWRTFQKSLDDRQEQMREKAAQIKLGPAPKIADLNSRMDDMQQRIDTTTAEEVPLKAELQQAQIDLTAVQGEAAGLDDKYYQRINSLPQGSITKHISLSPNGRFTWVVDDPFAEGEKDRHYWIFSRATRADGRQYWSLHQFTISVNETVELILEPSGFVSTKAILRPDLSPEEQEQ